MNLAITLCLLGEREQARQRRDQSLDLARQTPHANSRCYAFHFGAMHDLLQGDAAAARANAEAALKLAEEQGLTLWLGWSAILRGWTVAAHGDDAGILEIRRGIDAARASGAALFHTYYLGLLAERLLAAGRRAEARATLDEADALVEQNDERFWETQLRTLREQLG